MLNTKEMRSKFDTLLILLTTCCLDYRLLFRLYVNNYVQIPLEKGNPRNFSVEYMLVSTCTCTCMYPLKHSIAM